MELSVRDYKRAIADGKLDDWSPKDIERWLHSDVGGIVGQDAACRAAAMIVYNHFERRPSVSLFIGPTGCGKTEIWRALRREYSADNVHIIDASTLTAEGWRGSNKISSIFRSTGAAAVSLFSMSSIKCWSLSMGQIILITAI